MIKNLLLLFCLLCFGCGIAQDKPQITVEPPILTNSETVITKHYLELGGLYNREYKITIRGTGEVFFKGTFAAKKPIFQEQWRISPEEVTHLVGAFRSNGFFELGDNYGAIPLADGSRTSISLVIDGMEKKVTRSNVENNTPEEKTLRKLELLINKIVEAESRIIQCCYFHNSSSESIP